jgi:hypothetical protein
MAPARRSPSIGPPTTTIELAALARPRSRSGVTVWRIVLRAIALTVSNVPAIASSTSPTQSDIVSRPKSVITTPQPAAPMMTARPWWRIRATNPESTEPTTTPTPGSA